MSSPLSSYVEAWQRRAERQAAETALRRERALELVPELAELLRTRFAARRVVLIGSLARGDFGPSSDIDLVAEGIPPERFFRAGVELERVAEGFDVDLIPAETATPEMLEVIESEGRELDVE